MHRVAICWLRRDLRLADNPALHYAAEHAERVLTVYIHAPDDAAPWQPGAASRWWLHHSLTELDRSLKRYDRKLIVRIGPSLDSLRQLVAASGATLVTWNRLYDPALVARDTQIKSTLQADGVQVQSCNAALLFEPWDVQTQQAQPYKVFTPFWRACLQKLDVQRAPLPPPQLCDRDESDIESDALEGLGLLPNIDWAAEFPSRWQPGEAGAQRALQRFIETHCAAYPTARDLPAQSGTSYLSPHLHFGEIGPRQILAALQAQATDANMATGRDAFLRELGWREFAHHVLYHFPHTTEQPFDARFADYPWRHNRAALRAWQRGKTGIPIVDAGMRELWRTGYMHNRVRMLVASLLTKNLRIHWLEGARWFWDTLVDADLANNSLGWQWTAGCGTDAAPYFRIFNPVTQGERFDAEGNYVRRWVPELAHLPNKWIQRPWDAPASVLKQAAVKLDIDYPAPIVDLSTSRMQALEGYKQLRSTR